MTLSSARVLWGCALGGPAKGRPTLHERTRAACSGYPPLPGVGRPRWRLPAGGVFLPRLAKATAPFPRLLFASRSVCVRYFVIISSFAFAELQSPSRAALRI